MGLMAPPGVHGRDARHSVREARRHHAESAEHLNFISLAAIPSHEALEQCMEGRQEKKRRVFSPPPPAKRHASSASGARRRGAASACDKSEEQEQEQELSSLKLTEMVPQRKGASRPPSSRGGSAVSLSRCESRFSLLWVSKSISDLRSLCSPFGPSASRQNSLGGSRGQSPRQPSRLSRASSLGSVRSLSGAAGYAHAIDTPPGPANAFEALKAYVPCPAPRRTQSFAPRRRSPLAAEGPLGGRASNAAAPAPA